MLCVSLVITFPFLSFKRRWFAQKYSSCALQGGITWPSFFWFQREWIGCLWHHSGEYRDWRMGSNRNLDIKYVKCAWPSCERFISYFKSNEVENALDEGLQQLHWANVILWTAVSPWILDEFRGALQGIFLKLHLYQIKSTLSYYVQWKKFAFLWHYAFEVRLLDLPEKGGGGAGRGGCLRQ